MAVTVTSCLVTAIDRASHAFQAAAPKLWNNLTLSLKSSRLYEVFRRRLSSHLFEQVFT